MAEALISVLLEQLASVVYQHTNEVVKLVLKADKDVKSFSSKLKAIHGVLEDAEKKQVTEARVRDWLQKLKDVSYEMDDVLDEWNTEILKQQVEEGKKKVCFPTPANCCCFGQVNKAIHHHNIARRIKKLNEKLTVIAAEREMYGFHQSTIGGHDDQQLIHRRKTSSLVDISMIFGREEEKEMLLSKLLRGSNEDGGRFLVIPIVGMGGMGKTTLAQLAYNNEKVTAHFHKKVWVCVSDPFDEIKIAKAITESLLGTPSSSNELEILLQCIKTHIENKKLLLVLDDVWTEDETKWENLKLPIIMRSCEEGSSILVTTRKQGVAKMMRATNNMIYLDELNDKDCLALFNSIAFLDREEDEADEFGAIGKEIVKRCKGLPLAAKTLGSLLWYKKTRKEWWDVLNSKIWELEEVEEQVFRPLLLSYYDLAPAIKRCLLYCAIFPKDYDLKKDNLIELWMSQDYLNSKEKKEKKRIGQYYFENLSMRSFFQDFRKDEMGNVYGCKIHDIVHDFVMFLTKKECTIIDADAAEGANKKIEPSGDKVRHLTLINVPEGPLSFPTSCYGCKNMRTLTLLDSSITTISSGSIMQMKCLRTLNLSGNMLDEVPKKIGELIHLRYMDLSRSRNLKELSEAVCDLYNLQTLVLVHCYELEKLPKAMGKLINLKHLYVDGCHMLEYLPKGIGSLKSLQVLDCFHVCEGDDEALKFGDLGIMDQLQGSLKIGWLGKVDASEIEKAQLGNKEHLSHLKVDFLGGREQRKGDSEIVKALQPHQNLESLSILWCHGTTESLYWIKSLRNLRKLYLDGWRFCEFLPPLGKLPSLEILTIMDMWNVKKVGVEFVGIEEEQVPGTLFPKLKRLCFWNMPNWEEWAFLSEITIMPRLSELRIEWCPKLKALPNFLYKIKALRTLEIVGCSILEGEYEKGVGKEWHNISHIPNVTVR
ncbi:putative P-loop containing nucleoside triphosphate hydrolase, leucine-rich repeat domain, L [Rosa chinensis]|uniref:Putative P-loop containing nucleoside triphosphate hydrolase, leucine-rich repeat domain, L n=1 Tax=Rosa chinensis TaxID=74649 RepID=A0A2P6PF40_ROSCH|nr:putative disease resistance protein RGA3 [Rosa chinensis]PRQ20540.1 putative P-loop containing nucleoside triphosphate hydrolase, leucine-rich repeat domain, L [Rosa chinensis]